MSNAAWNEGGVLNESNYSQVGKSLRQRVFKLKIVLGSKGLMTSDLHQNYIISRYSQGQHTLVTSRSQGQSQGHEGR